MPRALTIKQEKFAQGLFTGLTQREAYKGAYDCQNMTDKSIDENACRLANDSKIISRLEELINELKERNMITVNRVLAEMSHIAFADIKDLLSYRTEKTVVGYNEDGQPIIDYKTVIDLKDSDSVDTRSIAEVQQGPNGTFKFKQYCKDDALVKLGQHLGLFKENVNLSGSLAVKIVDDIET
jgi:phage terminase small subunit